MRKPPSYRRRTKHDREVAYVTLSDSVTKRRKDYDLGMYGTDESRERYARLLAAWEARGRRLPAGTRQTGGPTVAQVCAAYLREISDRDYSYAHLRTIKLSIRNMRTGYGSMAAAQFGLRDLRALRKGLQASGLKRCTVMMRTRVLIGIWKWAASEELIPVECYQKLALIEPIRQTADDISDTPPAPINAIDAVRKIVTPTVVDMIDLQLVTGMRPGEVCKMRACDLNINGRFWVYKPTKHKTAWRGKKRTIYIGPKGQDIIFPRLSSRGPAIPVFTTRSGRPWNTSMYRESIADACAKAGVPCWTPRQLRRNFATMVRQQHGLEAAQILLGHSSAALTDAVYAERDMAKALDAISQVG